MLVLTKLLSPLLKPPFLSPTDSYYFIEVRAAVMNLTEAVQLILPWIRGCVFYEAPEISRLGTFDLEDRLTSIIIKPLMDLVPGAPPQHQSKTIYVIK